MTPKGHFEINWPLESLSPSSIWFMKIKDLRVALFGAWTNRFSRSTKIPLFASTSPLFVTACGEFVLCPEPMESPTIWGGWTVIINILLLFSFLFFQNRGGGGQLSPVSAAPVWFHKVVIILYNGDRAYTKVAFFKSKNSPVIYWKFQMQFKFIGLQLHCDVNI